ncbi:MAG: Mrp/NBP35 family ATP-binding protein, partial [Muribaculaceae bacterium]|nr:Mrp/NBP35 family ATP-binding protein [Muribaculaceae bacterium]
MAWFTPERHPDERYYLFGQDGAKQLAEELGVKLLGQIPVVADICARGDSGEPIALQDSITGQAFMDLAGNVTDAVIRRNSELPPTTKVEVTHK